MQLDVFRGRDLRDVMDKVKRTLGEDAMIVRTEVKQLAYGKGVEIIASSAAEVEAFRNSLGAAAQPPREQASKGAHIGPYLIALVGPAGSGKTSTAIKMALSNHGLGDRKVGLLTLDTYRVGALAELQTYAEITGLPLEVVYARRELSDAAVRLRECDAIIIDTPGRGPEAMQARAPWHDLLHELRPDEVHLVVPAGVRLDVATHLSSAFMPLGVTHLLPTKLDEVPGDRGLAELAEAARLPVRWVTDGQDIPGNIRPAGPRIFSSLGQSAAEDTRAVAVG
jgi:flagellar biosynthesis protein FlhF